MATKYKITCSNPLIIKKYVQNYVYDGVFGSNDDKKTELTIFITMKTQ